MLVGKYKDDDCNFAFSSMEELLEYLYEHGETEDDLAFVTECHPPVRESMSLSAIGAALEQYKQDIKDEIQHEQMENIR